jgi:hypothetical protein
VLPDPVLAGRTPVAPALAPPDAVLDAVLPVWLTLVPLEVTELDADADGDADFDGLALVDVDADGVVVGFCSGALVGVVGGVGLLAHGVAVALAVVLLPVALVFALADAVEAVEALAEAVVGAVLVGVTVGLGVVVAVLAGVVSLGLVLLVGLAVVLLVVLLVGLVALAAGVTLGLVDLVALFKGDGEEVGEHAVAFALARLLEMLLGLTPPADADGGLPGPVTLGGLLLLWEVNPTAEPICPNAWRSGGTARATPMANTTQAAARAGRSSPSRQSRGWCGA